MLECKEASLFETLGCEAMETLRSWGGGEKIAPGYASIHESSRRYGDRLVTHKVCV